MAEREPGTLYVVATPIGNLGDIAPRAVETLRRVTIIACEDTRHSGVLLAHLGISTPTIALHDFNEEEMALRLLDRIRNGEEVALISDAGTPLISDPGFRVVRGAHECGIPVVSLPGPSALIAALAVSGLATDRFSFEGFPPAKAAARRALFASLALEPRTLIFYESAHRVVESLADMEQAFGPLRMAAVARELTKRFETVYRNTLSDVRTWLSADKDRTRGEFVCMVAGASEEQLGEQRQARGRALLDALLPHMPPKQAVALAQTMTDGERNYLYKYALSQRE